MRHPQILALIAIVAVTLVAGGVGPAAAVPVHGEPVTLTQPDGRTVDARAWGDEYHQRLEDRAGYTLVRDEQSGWVCYARREGSELVSTGVPAHAAPPADLAPGVRLPASVIAGRVAAAREAAGQPRAGQQKIDYPLPAASGEVRGIALLVDFSDEPATVDPGRIDRFLNERGYTGGGNNGSVRDYYHDVSGGQLDLTHEVPTAYYRAAHPKSYYENPGESTGWRARALVTEALQDLERRGFDFSRYDANGDAYVDLVSLFYAGEPRWSWGVGLWPQAGEIGFQADGVTARIWQVSPLGEDPRLGIPCHEIGHALLQWDDLYDPAGLSWGVGLFCVMSNPSSGTNPLPPCAPLRMRAGWTENVLLDGVMPDQVAVAGQNRVFYRQHPLVETELYVVENRARGGRDAALPDEGLAVYHVDWRGSNNRPARRPDAHYMVTLVQADGRWDLENDANWGDTTDLFGAPDFVTFTPETTPAARWWRGQSANLYLENISAPGDTMTFDFSDGIGILPLQLRAEPDALEAPWRILGADGYTKTGRGSRLVHVPAEGSYLVQWETVPGWQAPPPSSVWVPEAGPVPEAAAAYTHPPFARVVVPALADSAHGRGGQLLDLDGDGDLDLYLARLDGGDRLLRNDGGWQFTDVTPPALAADAPTLGAAWADADADGDQDVLLVRRGEPAQLLRQEAPGVFASAPEPLPAALDSLRGATWLDVDGDRRLDLHLVREGQPDLLLRHPPDVARPAPGDYLVADLLPGYGFARTMSGSWGDYDGDGRLDLYMVNRFGANVLARNRWPDPFENTTHGGLGLPWRGGASTWGDHDNDGDLDLLVVQDGAPDALLTQYEGTFVMENAPRVELPGPGRDAVWGDLDNDGDLDLFQVRDGQPDRLLMKQGDAAWVESPLLLDDLAGPTAAILAGDLDHDGGLDLVLDRRGAPPLVLRNTMNRGNWLILSPEGSGTLREPVGTVARVHLGDRVQTRQVPATTGPGHPPVRLHFGLGAAAQADSVVLHWPTGATEVLRGVPANQVLTVTQPVPDGTGGEVVPEVTRLLPAYPNPFNPGTSLAFTLARDGRVRLAVHDLRGRRVAVVHDGPLAAGRHVMRWEGRDASGRSVASGVYLARLVADGVEQTRRLTLVR